MTTELFTTPTLTTHEHIGFELGWDYAHHRLLPPAPYAQEPSPLRNGLLAGQAAFGARTLQPRARCASGCNCACTPGCAGAASSCSR